MQEFLSGNSMLVALAGAGLIALAAVVGVAVLLSRQSARLRRDRERMLRIVQREGEIQSQGMERLNQAVNDSLRRVSELSGTMEARMQAFARKNDEHLGEMRRVVETQLEGRLSESFRLVNGQLADVHRGIGEMRQLAASVSDLKKVLGNVKTRGVWGEVLLRNLMQQMFAPGQYLENAAVPEGSATRVEFALKLPHREREWVLLSIDSKFPQEDYVRLVDAEAASDAELREKCARQLERAVLEQARRISEKYICPPQTVDFAVMFLPVEGLYAEVTRRPGLIERVQTRFRVLVCGPSTLCALLTSLQMGMRSSELEQRSGEVLRCFDELRGEFARFQESIARTRQRLDQAGAELDAMESRARKIAQKLR